MSAGRPIPRGAGQVLDAFELVDCAGSIPWLFGLRSSELFLAMWRQEGSAACRDILFASRQAAARFPHAELLLRLFAEVVAAEPQPQPADLGVGARVVNFRARGVAAEFEQGEITAQGAELVTEQGPTRMLTVTWDSSGSQSAVDAAEFNVSFTAFRMRERVLGAVAAGRNPEIADAEREAHMRG